MAGLDGYPGSMGDIVQGDTKKYTITITDNTVDPAVPEDITGAKFVITLKTARDKELLPSLEVIIDPPTDPTNGITAGKLSDTQTQALAVGTYYYSIRYIDPIGDAFVIDLGTLEVLAAVSDQIA